LIADKIDRIFMTTDWEIVYPLVKASCLPKNISDHTPLLLEAGDNCAFGKKKKLGLRNGGFRERTLEKWSRKHGQLVALT
jgi:hypothetical protein